MTDQSEHRKSPTTKRMVIMLIIVAVIFGGIFGYQAFTARMIKKYMAAAGAPPVTVTAMPADYQTWSPRLSSVGTLRAERGVDVTCEIGGQVRALHMRAGAEGTAGERLLELNAETDKAQLEALRAAAELARTVYERDRQQFEIKAVSQAVLDADAADLKVKRAQAAQQQSVIDKKSIRAPFAGRLGISTVNIGQYLNPGDKIVTLQDLDTLCVDFYLPQQNLSRIKPGQQVTLTTDAFPGEDFIGTITAVNPKVDTATRNFQIEARVRNPGHKLFPGMFATLSVSAGEDQSYLTLPKTAVTYNPYGDTVYLVEEKGTTKDGKPALFAKQTFVTVGPERGDQTAIVKGIKKGDMVITSGQLKLKNGSPVVIDNAVRPLNDPAPRPADR